MVLDYEPYRKAIYERVCQHCVDLGSDGKCTLPKDMKCGVELYLPQMVGIVHSVNSEKMDDYVSVLRKRICASCRHEEADSSCRLRAAAECGLDRYFELIVEAIEAVDARLR